MVQGQTKPVYKSASYDTKDSKDKASCKKSQFDFKPQERKETPKNTGVVKKADSWGKFKNEQLFKSLHIC